MTKTAVGTGARLPTDEQAVRINESTLTLLSVLLRMGVLRQCAALSAGSGQGAVPGFRRPERSLAPGIRNKPAQLSSQSASWSRLIGGLR